jgi:hypothetical protein
MKKSWLICLCLLLWGSACVWAEIEVPRTVVEVPVSGPEQVMTLDRLGLSLDWVKNGVARGLITKSGVETLRAAGFDPKVIYWDFREENPSAWLIPGYYHSYAAMLAALDSIQDAQPTIAHLDTLGFSILNRAVLGLHITLNPTSGKRGKPKYNVNGDHHGNELIGGEAALAFAKYLANNYGSNSLVTRLVDESDVWVVPIVNPDGREANQRGNNRGVDINRNYGYEWNATGGTGVFSEPEIQAMRNLFMKGPYVASMDFHSGAMIILYVWGFTTMGAMDSAAMRRVGQIYNTYYPVGYGQISRDLYSVWGGSTDYYYGCGGDIISFAAELSNSYAPPASAIDTICARQITALIPMMQETRKGLWGMVRDSVTHRALPARLVVANRGWCCYTDPEYGDYHKYLYPSAGTYQVKAYANGYDSKTLQVTVGADTFSQLDFDLKPNAALNWSGFTCPIIRSTRTPSVPADLPWTQKCLGVHDSVGLALSHSSVTPYIVLDMGPTTPIINRTGSDFTVYLTAAASYTVQATNNMDGTWASCGSGSGTQQYFDLTTAGLDSARYVRITGTVSLDAIEALPRPSGVEESPRVERQVSVTPSLVLLGPNPTKGGLFIKTTFPAGWSRLAVYDIAGRLVKMLNQATHPVGSSQTFSWNGIDDSGRKVTSGTYFAHLETPQGNCLARVVLLR